MGEESRIKTEPKKTEEFPDLQGVSEELSKLNTNNYAIGQTEMTPGPDTVVTSVLEPTHGHGDILYQATLEVVNPDSLVDNNATGPTEMTATCVKRQTSSLETPDNSMSRLD